MLENSSNFFVRILGKWRRKELKRKRMKMIREKYNVN
jgi:hypothetical protein